MTNVERDPRRRPWRRHAGSLDELAAVFGRRRIALAADDDGRTFLVRPDSVAVESGADPDKVAKVVEKWDQAAAKRMRGRSRDRGAPGRAVTKVTLPAPARHRGVTEPDPLENVRQRLDELGAAEIRAEPNYVVLGGQTVTGSPFGQTFTWAGDMAFIGDIAEASLRSSVEPAEDPGGWPAPLGLAGRNAPKILVLDTGLRLRDGDSTREAEHDVLRACCQVGDDWVSSPAPRQPPFPVDDDDEDDDDDTGFLDFEAGHGTFIAGLVHRECPDAEIYTAGVLSSFGDGDVAHVLERLDAATAAHGPFDVVVMSFGAFLPHDQSTLFRETLVSLLGGALGVAAAGNQQTCRPYFPAAFPEIVGVGALAADGRAWFSNFGPWVDACAPGVDVVSTFFVDVTEPAFGRHAERRFEGFARWSGTSFSAPKVAAALAQAAYLDGTATPADVWQRVAADYQRLRMPDLGIVFNV